MKNFIDISNRLKTVLSVTMDKELAELLGISKYSFAERKKRNSFPEKELKALANDRPDLNLDVDYILTGYSEAKETVENNFWDTVMKGYSQENHRTRLNDESEGFDVELPPTPNDASSKVLLNSEEMMLVSCYRKSSEDSKQKILDVAKMARDLWLVKLQLEEVKAQKS